MRDMADLRIEIRGRTSTMKLRRLMFFLSLSLLVLMSLASPIHSAETAIEFNRDVLPLLSDNCFQCHGPDESKNKAGLRLDLRENALRDNEGVAAVIPGNSAKSELIRRITTGNTEDVMPPVDSKNKLNAAQIEILRRWIDDGAKWGNHWAFEKLYAPTPPVPLQFENRVINSIDRFVFRRLELENLAPSTEAPKETLIRRVTLDLTGLPPTIEETEAFLADASSAAYEKVVDRLLHSPAFGERMAWDWLDTARYADSNGYQGDRERTMWPWRDWVVTAFNRNLAFDKFTTWQLAGDLLPDSTQEQKLATAFLRNHMINGEGGRIAEENRVDYVMDMMETTGTVWLGLTMNCSRCHDHKYDPLSREDYYSFFDFFNQTPVTGAGGDPQTKPVIELPTENQQEQLANFLIRIKAEATELTRFEQQILETPATETSAQEGSLIDIPQKIRSILDIPPAKRSRTQLSDLNKEFGKSKPAYAKLVATLRKSVEDQTKLRQSIVKVMVMEDMAEKRKTFMLEKGSYEKPGGQVEAHVPEHLPPMAPGEPRNRLGLANWLVSTENPLTARVTVNRFWQQFFGVGLVKTPENFGTQGEFPSHPQLLDWLSAEFVTNGWDIKKLCRLIVTSATYRQSSKTTPSLAQHDPANRLLARGSRFRIPSWMIRDQALAAGGLLMQKIAGKPVNTYQPAGIWEEATFGNKKYKQDSGENLYRRSLYTFWRRIVGPTVFFDTPSRQTCTVKQPRTNSPLHALTTLNDITYVEAARAMAERVLLASGTSIEERIELAFRLVLTRHPDAEERSILKTGYERLRNEFQKHPEEAMRFLSVGESRFNKNLNSIELAAFAGTCSAILNLDESVTKE